MAVSAINHLICTVAGHESVDHNPEVRGSCVAGAAACGGACPAGRAPRNGHGCPIAAFRERCERGENPPCAIAATGARNRVVGLTLLTKQFELEAALGTAVFVNWHLFLACHSSNALRNTSGTSGARLSIHVLRHVKQQKL